ncbi:MAG: DUF362 domain-containing protein [Anaerolineae bacterium]|nr:DUF362 domain-containing protein [Anaerolineae bacterium]
MNHSQKHKHARRAKWTFWGVGLGSLAWLLLRSGTKPQRLAYPCQRAALANSAGFLGYLATVLGLGHFYHRLKRRGISLTGVGLFAMMLALLPVLSTANLPLKPARANLALPAWTSATAVSNVFAVSGAPVPECSLDGGVLPATAPCNDPAYALRDAGMDSLIAEMETRGDYFYKTAEHPAGIVGADDVVVIKINNQWAGEGSGDGHGRLSTNADALKGLIYRILSHPQGFTGEIVIAENVQSIGIGGWDVTPANAEDQGQTYQDVVAAFWSQGYTTRVSFYNWTSILNTTVSGGNVADAGYPAGEYAQGNMSDAYILLEDSAGSGTNELSYPKFQTTNGKYVSMRYGVWNPGTSTYDSDRLTWINMPVLKKHCMAGTTAAWKNLIGFVTDNNNGGRYGDWDAMHNFFWGFQDGMAYGLLGREIALVRAPDLHIVDAIWVAIDANYYGPATRQDVLLASTDPYAVDWYASEYVMRPVANLSDGLEPSAARAGTFRDATRVNQNASDAVWPGGSYPYMDLLDGYDENTPSANEHDQLNVYVVSGGTACDAITGVTIAGPASGYTGTLYTFTATIAPVNASTPVTPTWEPEPDSGQATLTATYTWAITGAHSLTVTAENCGGIRTATHAITVMPQFTPTNWIYLPLVIRN